MKTKRVFTLVFLFAVSFANAQLVLTNSNVATSANATEKEQLVSTSNLAVPARGTNMQWDYSSMTDISGSINAKTYNAPPTSGTFSTATRTYIQTTNMAGAAIKSTIYVTNDVNGYGFVGYSVDNRQTFSLYAATGGKNDSLIIPLQDSAYSARQYILKYPVSYGGSYNMNWSFSGNLSDHFFLDIPSVSSAYVNLYGTRTIARIVTDSVIGWGTLKVPTESNSVRVTSQAYSVLLVKEDVTDVTKFSVNGLSSTVLGDLLTTLGLSQGAQTTSSTYIFYRAGYANSLMFYEVDPSAGYDPDNTSTTGIDDENIIINFQQYPNPVTQSNLNFAFDKPDNNPWIMTITNEMGQVVQTMAINQPTGPVQLTVNLPANLNNGIYFYNMADGNESPIQGKFILNR